MMDLNKLQSSGAYDQDSGVIGKPVSLNLLKRTVDILVDEDSIIVAKLESVTFLEVIGTLNGINILDGDVLSGGGQNYEVELLENKQDIVLHQLNAKLERVEAGEVFDKNTLESIADLVELVGSIYEMRNDLSVVDFNIRIVRFFDGEDTVYYYACNNKETEEVELIKVIYVGHMLLEEELYERENLSYDDYLALLTTKEFKEVSPSELSNYVLGMSGRRASAPTYGVSSKLFKEDEDSSLEEDLDLELDDSCDECGEGEEDCECVTWN